MAHDHRHASFRIGPIGPERLEEAAEVACRAFGGPAGEEERRYFRSGFDLERALCAFDGDDRIIATSTSLPLELTLPNGGLCRAGGVAWATTLPDHRGQGILRALMEGQEGILREQREAMALLTASSGTLYRRFGYGPATMFAGLRIVAGLPRPSCASTGRGRSRPRLLASAEARKILPGLYGQLRPLHVGAVDRSAAWWDVYLDDRPNFFGGDPGAAPLFHVVSLGADDEPEGYVSYRLLSEWLNGQPLQTLEVEELLAATPEAYVCLWSYCLESVGTNRVVYPRGRTDEPLRWLLSDPRCFEVVGQIDHLWAHLLDIPAALSARGYAEAGGLTFEVEHGSGAERGSEQVERYTLEVVRPGAGGALCAAGRTQADLVVDSADLGSVYLGAVSFSALAAVGRVRELTPGACRRADRLFAVGCAPHCTTKF